MKPQEIFEFVITHLANQGSQSNFEYSPLKCAYRGSNNKRCAVGCLLPNDVYQPGMEGRAVENLIESSKVFPNFHIWLEKNAWFLENRGLLMKLQFFHDSYLPWQSVANFKLSVSELANKYQLSTDFINNLEIKLCQN